MGGVLVSAEAEAKIREVISGIKSPYGNRRLPVKWNFKDLKDTYKSQGLLEQYETLLKSSKEWRKEIIEKTLDCEYKVLLSCIESHSLERKIIKLRRKSLTQYAFTNALMRVALCAKEANPDHVNIILDWPDAGDPKPFDQEYAAAYNAGKTSDKSTKYYSGPLCELSFSDSISYCRMQHNTMLQFADLLVGAAREFIEYSLDPDKTGFGTDMFGLLKPKFYQQSGRIYGYGINVASSCGGIRQKIKNALEAKEAVAVA